MTNPHPITPPPELVQQWIASETYRYDAETGEHPDGSYEQRMCDLAAQWGADHELEACCEWLNRVGHFVVGGELRAARRPKPPSLKEQALELTRPAGTAGAYVTFGPEELALIHCALEQLDD